LPSARRSLDGPISYAPTGRARHAPPAARLAVVPGAGYLFEKAGTLEQVAELAADWFLGHIATRTQPAQ
jgi:hypothetical protein